MNIEDIFQDEIDYTIVEVDDVISNQQRQFISICDCLLTFSTIKINKMLTYYLKKIKIKLLDDSYLLSYNIHSDLEKLKTYQQEFKNKQQIYELLKDLEECFETYLILNSF